MFERNVSLMGLLNRGVIAMEGMADKEQEKTPAASPRSSDSTPKLTVETVYNHIYFYSDVNTDRCLAMIKSIREMDSSLRNERATRSLPVDFPMTPIWLHIHSGGGDLMAGLSVADQLKTIQSPIYSVVEGYCASAATLLSMACAKRYILPQSFMLIHQLSNLAWGTYEQLKDDMHMMNMSMEHLTNFYTKNSKMKRAKVQELLKRDSWFNAQECIELGLVDDIKNGD